MSRRRRRRRSKDINYPLYLGVITWLFLLGLIIFSSNRRVPPNILLTNMWNSITGKNDKVNKFPYIPVKEHESILELKNGELEALQKRLGDCMTQNEYKKAYVNVSNSTLNMRDKPDLVSNIILQIPNRSEVSILYFDNERYVMDGKYGRWCKIRYAGKEGWVWGNYLNIPEMESN